MRLPVTLAALAAAAFLALPSPAKAGGLHEMEKSWKGFCDWFHHRDAEPTKGSVKDTKVMKTKGKAKAAPKKMM